MFCLLILSLSLSSIEKARELQLGEGKDLQTSLGPLISAESKTRVEGIVERSLSEGASVPLDGRGVIVPGFEKGYFVGPTVITGGKISFSIFQNLNLIIIW